MTDDLAITVRPVAWGDARQTIRAIREAVFVREQGVPLEIEWDGLDSTCLHVLAHEAHGRPVGTARMLDDGKIGRMAVLTEWRGRGVGSALVDALLEVAADRGRSCVHLAAQTHAIEFYAKQGFQVVGEVFLEAGIPHCAMYCDLPRRHRVR